MSSGEWASELGGRDRYSLFLFLVFGQCDRPHYTVMHLLFRTSHCTVPVLGISHLPHLPQHNYQRELQVERFH